MAEHNMLCAARSFNRVLGELFSLVSTRCEPHELDYPIFYICRHTLELYLKVLLDIDLKTFLDKHQGAGAHSLDELVRAVEVKYAASFPQWAKARILDFHKIDPRGDLFRFGDWEPEGGEWWTDFAQLRLVLVRCQGRELQDGGVPCRTSILGFRPRHSRVSVVARGGRPNFTRRMTTP